MPDVFKALSLITAWVLFILGWIRGGVCGSWLYRYYRLDWPAANGVSGNSGCDSRIILIAGKMLLCALYRRPNWRNSDRDNCDRTG